MTKLNMAPILILALVLISACVQNSEVASNEEQIIASCIQLCKQKSIDGLANGPCLSNDIGSTGDEKWVCDVAHAPRQDVDNLPENQCSSFGSVAKHFVELNVNCELINKY
ncbi:MAG: hypothetical protein V1900_00655 [Candidatus Aenigmatarchaeota archaeon]